MNPLNEKSPALIQKKLSELEQKLKWNEDFLITILEGVNAIVVQLDIDGNIVFINSEFETITHYNRNEIIGKNWFETLIPPKLYPQVSILFKEFLQKGEVIENFENPILTKDGKEKVISWKNILIKRNNIIEGVISFGSDITDKLSLMNEFIDQQMSYKILIDNLPGVVYKCKNDSDYTMESISPKCLELTGYSVDEFISKSINWGQLILEEDKDRVAEEIRNSINQNLPFQLTYRIKTKDGRIKWLWEQGIMVSDKDSEQILEGYIVDVTDKVKAEEQLEIQREFFKQLFENSPIGIVILDRNDKIIDVNKAFEELFGFEREEVRGLSINQLIVPPDLKLEGYTLSEKVLSDEIVMVETKRMKKNGSLLDVLVIGYPILHKGERVGIFGMYKDITDQKMMFELMKSEKEKIEELNQLKSNFLFNISHEIRTPLNSILGFSDLLISELSEIKLDMLKDFAMSIKRGGLRLLNLMDNIIEISVIESSKSELKFEEVHILMVLEPVLLSFEAVASEKNLYLKKEFESNFKLLTDVRRLTLILKNIIDNATKFTHEGGVTVRTYLLESAGDNRKAVIEITDTGIGISEKFMAKLFEPYSQASAGLNREYEGIGLGLHLSKKLIELLGGRLEIISIPHKGTIVRIYLPMIG